MVPSATAAANAADGTVSGQLIQFWIDRWEKNGYAKHLREGGSAAASTPFEPSRGLEAAVSAAAEAEARARWQRKGKEPEETAKGKRKKLIDESAKYAENMMPAARRAAYEHAYKHAAELHHGRGLPAEQAAREAMAKYPGAHLSGETVRKSVTGQVPRRPGRKTIIPEESEKYIADLIKAMRALKFPVFRDKVMAMARALVAGTYHEIAWENETGPGASWYYGFLRRHGLYTNDLSPLECTRAQWTTAENALKHYDILMNVFLDLGIAVTNDAFDPTKENSEPIIIKKPSRIVSFDETKLSMDMTVQSRGKKLRSVTVPGEQYEKKEHLAAKGGSSATGVGGSTGDGESLPGLFIFSGGSIKPAWLRPPYAPDGVPLSSIRDPATGAFYAPTFFANPVGSMEFDLGVKYFETTITRVLKPTKEDPVVVICDGHGSHVTLELIEYCREHHIHIVLRPPHTTHKLQGEDVVNFRHSKVDFQQQKMEVLCMLTSEAMAAGSIPPTSLGTQHFTRCVKPVWDKHFW